MNPSFIFVCALLATSVASASQGRSEMPPPIVPTEHAMRESLFGAPFWEVLPHAQQLSDPDMSLTPPEVMDEGSDLPWKPAIAQRSVSGRVRETRWYRMDLRLPPLDQDHWVFFHRWPRFGTIDLWLVEASGTVSHQTLTSATPIAQRRLRGPGAAFILDIDDEPIRAYLRISPSESGLRFDPWILTARRHAAQVDWENAVFIAWAGMMLGLLFYNLVVYFSTLDRAYLYYCGFMGASTSFTFGLSGRGFVYVWPDSPAWDAFGLLFTGVAGPVFAILFSCSFLGLRENAPRLHGLLMALTCSLIVTASLALLDWTRLATSLLKLNALILYPVLLSSGIVVWRSGIRYARFYVLSWATFCASTFYFTLSTTGVIELSRHTTFIMLLSPLAEGFLLATALGDRINSFRTDVERLNVHLEQARQNLEIRVVERTAELVDTQRKLVESARKAGMAEIAIGVLHEIGNVLNTVVTRSRHLSDRVRASRVDRLRRGVALLSENLGDLDRFLLKDEKGRNLLTYFDLLTGHLESDRDQMQADLVELGCAVERIEEIVGRQHELAQHRVISESVDLDALVREAIDSSTSAGLLSGVEVDVHSPGPVMSATESHRVQLILSQLVDNAVQAMQDVPVDARKIAVSIGWVSEDEVEISIADTGRGFESDRAATLFRHGYTTAPDRKGFGLHHCANLATELGGRLQGRSAGEGCGAIFSLVLPSDRGSKDVDVEPEGGAG